MPVIKLDYTNTKVTDTFARSDYPTANNNSNALLTIGKSGENITIAYLKFDFGLIPNNAIINSATLTLATGGTNTSIPINAHAVLNDFDTTSLNWDNKPIYEEAISGSVPSIPTGSATSFSMDITSIAQKISNGTAYGIALESVDAHNNITLCSIENSGTAQRPFLTIDYTIPTTDKKQVELVGSEKAKVISQVSTGSIPIPKTIQKGDMLVAYIHRNSNPSVTVAIPSGWSLLSDEIAASSNDSLSIHYKVSDGTETLFPISFEGGTAQFVASIHVYRNVKSIYEHKPINNRTSQTSGFPQLPDDLGINRAIILITTMPNASSSTPPLNFVEDYEDPGNITMAIARSYNYGKTVYTQAELTTVYSSSTTTVSSKLISLEPITNEAPHIDGADRDLGALSSPLIKPYTVTDTESDTITITEKLNGSVIRTFTGSGEQTLNLTAQWASLPVGKHTVTVEANDDYNNPSHTPTVRTWTFLKILPNTATIVESVQGLQQVVPYLQGQKVILADAIRAKGGTVNDTDRLETMATAIRNSKTKKWASGYYPMSGSFYAIITGIDFLPKYIIAFIEGDTRMTTYDYEYSSTTYLSGNVVSTLDGSTTYVRFGESKLDLGQASGATKNVRWIAIE